MLGMTASLSPSDEKISEPVETPAPQDWARRDLCEAVRVAEARDGYLLTAGERQVVQRFLDLPAPAASLYARLLGRRRWVFPLESLSYPEVPDITVATTQLQHVGLAWRADRVAPSSLLIEAHTLDELRHHEAWR